MSATPHERMERLLLQVQGQRERLRQVVRADEVHMQAEGICAHCDPWAPDEGGYEHEDSCVMSNLLPGDLE